MTRVTVSWSSSIFKRRRTKSEHCKKNCIAYSC